MKKEFRAIPSIDKLMREPALMPLTEECPRFVVLDAAREVIARLRERLIADDGFVVPGIEQIAEQAASLAKARSRRSLIGAINATGVVLNTGLGRAALSKAAQEAIIDVAAGHSLVEVDRESGKRGSRQDHVRSLLQTISGAENALVVNNAAAAVFLCVNTLALGREVIISRGQLVEIGGSFRMPDIIAQAGAKLVEVGATNRTRLSDYEKAITENTALILRCHPSNFKMVGFTEETPPEQLVELGEKYNIPIMDDAGSGCFVDTSRFGLEKEPMMTDSVKAGCDVITFSGDKMLGGPQAGIIVGKTTLVQRIAKNPLARAVRIDKLTLAALEATLRLYLDPETLAQNIPTLKYLSRSLEELSAIAKRLRNRIQKATPLEKAEIKLIDGNSQVGGGSLPGQLLPTKLVAVQPKMISVDELAKRLRLNDPPIFARIENEQLCFDPRTLEKAEIEKIAVGVSRGLS